jgi:predicted nucleic acid-binding protein
LITLDTGVLVAIERHRPKAWALLQTSWSERLRLTIPAPVWGEWHAGSPHHGLGRLAKAVVIEPLTAALARSAGEALAALRLGREIGVGDAEMIEHERAAIEIAVEVIEPRQISLQRIGVHLGRRLAGELGVAQARFQARQLSRSAFRRHSLPC